VILTDRTLSILKNFSSISQSILIRRGNVLSTVNSLPPSLYARAEIEQTFPEQCAIYDLPKFLSAVSMFDQPQLDFQQTHFVISDVSDDKQKIKFTYAEPAMITNAPLDIKRVPHIAQIKLRSEQFKKLIRAASVLQLSHVIITNDRITATNIKDRTSDKFDIEFDKIEQLPDTTSIVIRIEHLIKLMAQSYLIEIVLNEKTKGARFLADSMLYYIALEVDSTL
jgi:hypothetical protein